MSVDTFARAESLVNELKRLVKRVVKYPNVEYVDLDGELYPLVDTPIPTGIYTDERLYIFGYHECEVVWKTPFKINKSLYNNIKKVYGKEAAEFVMDELSYSREQLKEEYPAVEYLMDKYRKGSL